MAVNFNKPTCVTVTSEAIFGICDDAPPSVDPAYLSFVNAEDWIAWVDNEKIKDITFTAIDHCVEIVRANGEQESRCDGMLTFDRTISFVELKDRDGGRWLGDATDQLKITIKIYKADVGLTAFDRYFAYVVNKQRPNFKAASTSFSQKFEDETDFVLMVEQMIKID
jgi:hypothetical protein